MYIQCIPKNVPLLIFWIGPLNRSKISWFEQFFVYGILRKLATSRAIKLPTSPEKCHCTTLWNSGLLLLPACHRNIIIKCFTEEIKVSNKNCEVNESAVCFLYNIFFLCYFYSGSLYCFNQSLYCFLQEKVGGFEKSRFVGCEKNRLLLLTLTFNTNTKQ